MGSRTSIDERGKFPRVLVFILVVVTIATFRLLFSTERTTKRTTKHLRITDGSNSAVVALNAGPRAKMGLGLQGLQHGVTTVYIIPGGGTNNGEYPEWSKQRTLAAFEHSQSNPNSIFVALSADSLNTPNPREDERTVFECQWMIKQLVELGVPRERIFGGFHSWDAAANAQVARQYVEALMTVKEYSTSQPLRVEVFVSDFYAARVEAAFHWVFGLSPSIVKDKLAALTVHKVSNASIQWPSEEDFQQRSAHEEKGLEAIHQNAEVVSSMQELMVLLLLGPGTGSGTPF